MLNERNKFHEDFSWHLRKALQSHFGGKRFSATKFAIAFNLNVPSDACRISGETARRWLTGLCVPDSQRLRLLAVWLRLDLNAIFGVVESSKTAEVEEQRQALRKLLNKTNDELQSHLLCLFEAYGAGSKHTWR